MADETDATMQEPQNGETTQVKPKVKDEKRISDDTMQEPQNGETTHAEPEVKDEKRFYDDANDYWTNISPNLTGMLGGYERISPTDINGSKAFLRPFLKVGNGETGTHHALDCGAGIGRITKRLLLPLFDSVDMVELNQKFLDSAPKFIGEPSSRIGKYICSGLQEFTPEEGRYDLIWCQWVLGHLTEDHLVQFLNRCQKGLKPNGIMIIKENVSQDDEDEFDETDSSFTRAKKSYVDFIQKSNFTIIKEQKQKGFPKGIYGVYMWALR